MIVGESSGKAGIGGFVECCGALREEARRGRGGGKGRGRKRVSNTGTIRGFVPENIVLVELFELVEVVVMVGVGLFEETHEADGGRRR